MAKTNHSSIVENIRATVLRNCKKKFKKKNRFHQSFQVTRSTLSHLDQKQAIVNQLSKMIGEHLEFEGFLTVKHSWLFRLWKKKKKEEMVHTGRNASSFSHRHDTV